MEHSPDLCIPKAPKSKKKKTESITIRVPEHLKRMAEDFGESEYINNILQKAYESVKKDPNWRHLLDEKESIAAHSLTNADGSTSCFLPGVGSLTLTREQLLELNASGENKDGNWLQKWVEDAFGTSESISTGSNGVEED